MSVLFDPVLNAKVRNLSRNGTLNIVNSTASIAASGYRTDVNITGSGTLLFVATRSGPTNRERFRITIDGNPAGTIGLVTGNLDSPYFGAYRDTSTQSLQGKFFVFGLRFTSSLLVETNNVDTSSSSPITTIAYLV